MPVSTEHQQIDMVELSEWRHRKRERLTARSVGGQARQYFWNVLPANGPEGIDSMRDDEIDKLYINYEAWGAKL